MDVSLVTRIRMREARKRLRGLSQDEAAKRAEVSRKTWGDWERGRTSIRLEDLSRIASALETDVGYLVSPEAGGNEDVKEFVSLLPIVPFGIRQQLLLMARAAANVSAIGITPQSPEPEAGHNGSHGTAPPKRTSQGRQARNQAAR